MKSFTGDSRLRKWAEVIVDFCTVVKKGERVEITGETGAKPLMLELYQRCLEVGAYPVIQPSFQETAEIFYSIADMDQLTHIDPIAMFTAKNTQVSLHILAETNTKALSHVNPVKMSSVRKARSEISKIRKENVRWNVTSFPTDAYAQDAGMSFRDFSEFLMNAGFLNSENPLKTWQKLRDRQRQLVDALQGTKTFKIENSQADLELHVTQTKICESSGGVNMPDGEVYTGPNKEGVNGFINFSFPGHYLGQVVEGIRMEFKNGEAVNVSADTNESFLLEMLDTDEGSRYIGELGIGTNWNVDRFTGNLLFDEKMGGTIHLAMGDGYRETLSTVRSAIHWDILHDLRQDGRILVDNELFMENGSFKGRFADIWQDGVN